MAVGQFGSNPSLTLIPAGSIGPVPAVSPTLVYDDMNAGTGGVARGTSIGSSFTTVYSYAGSGLLFAFTLGLNNITNTGWFVRMIVDGNDAFIGASGISIGDCISDDIYSLQINASNDMVSTFAGLIILNSGDGNFRWEGPNGYPVGFNSSVEIQVRKNGTSQSFNGGLLIRS